MDTHSIAVLEWAAVKLGFAGEIVPGVRFATSSCAAIVHADPEETARRAAVGLGPLTDYRLVDALAQLPLNCPVAWDDLDPVVSAVLDCAPPGVVHADTTHVRRLWRPALSVTGVLVASTDWRAGFEQVGIFAPDAARGLVLIGHPRHPDQLLHEAQRFGIGVVVASLQDAEAQLLSAPRADRPLRPSPRHWRFLEAVFAAWSVHRAGSTLGQGEGYASSAHARR
jgi:hypothetical protein